MTLSSNYALKGQRLQKILAKTLARKVPEQPSYGNFCKVTQNPHSLKKYKGGTKGNFSKIAIFIFAQTAAPKVLEWPSYGNFREVIQNPHFLNKRNGGTKENFSKIFQKVDLV